ncbi:hypothetical protein N7478_011976 [Penicillium angulare]|uniref:uncharacterized protein n=1 Tax=Penicillium angulare TaxID=116970 RepID=UPI0025412E64|nr:uncharacterized protein N7478_011976 [Penicillium angulare]KAJ5261381.1 hypothetical protein N7478_011976 [Penicillium angulare]
MSPLELSSYRQWKAFCPGSLTVRSQRWIQSSNVSQASIVLLILINDDTPETWGREVWGEAKKTGATRLWRSGNCRYGFAERNGVRLVEVEMECGDDLPPQIGKGSKFEIKAYPHSQGRGLQ